MPPKVSHGGACAERVPVTCVSSNHVPASATFPGFETAAGQTVTAHVSDSTITVELDGQVRVIRRTTDVPIRNVKANKPYEGSDVV
ncbi:hypothetical protein GCM10017557_57930 [Streptomyces aurantiacus]|uniref:Uncharacterized protein n=1 Tax=Streptomyces aurantiacus TaxID=47760 RepID=A0A7G1PAF7_9ACTN|nr:hypothetical protein GCM10017557_57930 [Streptomyces aurantiacus]